MYGNHSPQNYSGTRPLQPRDPMRGQQGQRADSQGRDSGYGDAAPMSPGIKGADHPMTGTGGASSGMGGVHGPDLLAAAFHQAVKPYTERIDILEQQLAEMQDMMQMQDQQRAEIFSWIDKRGLRPGEFLLLLLSSRAIY